MNDLNSTIPTISTPYIYLKLALIKDSPLNKITFPKTFFQLMNIATRMFKEIITVKTIFTLDGIPIESLNDVVPGSVLLCSELLPGEMTQSIKKQLNISTPKTKQGDVVAKSSFSRLFGTNINNNKNQSKNKKGNSKKDQNANTQKGKQANKNNEKLKAAMTARENKKKDSMKEALRKKLSSTPQSALPEPIEDYDEDSSSHVEVSIDGIKSPNRKQSPGKNTNSPKRKTSPNKNVTSPTQQKSSPNRNKPFSNISSPNQRRTPSKAVKLRQSENASPNAYFNDIEQLKKVRSQEEIDEVEESSIYDITSMMLDNDSLTKDSQDALLCIGNDSRSFIAHLPELEEAQQMRWFNKGLEILQSFGLPEATESLIGYDSMIGTARSIMVGHRFNKKGESTHRFNIAITGPRKSGKTTFLGIFMQELFLELIATDKWKRTFIFFLDMETILDYKNDIESFYIYMINSTFKQLEYQCPQYKQYFPLLTKYFLSITSLKSLPQFPKPFRESEETHTLATKMQSIAEQLSEVWNNPDMFNQFVTNIVMFPTMISDVLEFEKKIFVFDNLDLCDIFIDPTPPFSSETENFQFAYLIMFMLQINDYIISCKNQYFFTNMLIMIDSKPPIVDFVSTLNLSLERPYPKYQFNVNVGGEIYPLTVDHCGGVPSYIQAWDSLNQYYEKIQREMESKDEEEMELLINEKVQEVIELFYKCEDDYQLEVDSATRITRT